ncbi:gasdermin-A3-like [Oxyura jamaicensis]|uniref:gasdermin-A3-like n=1 Tax=Oxyura jamaicensis TaxID=8884 RepID=UPI0015A6D4CD|nr:gasdermin-A3-like [Oxyura jamaicensis]
MFKKVTQNVAKQMDPRGDLVPVESIVDQDHFKTFCLVRRKGKTAFRQLPRYKRTEYKLHDVLLPGKDDKSDASLLCGDQQDSRQYATAGSACDQVDATVSLPVEPALVELGASASFSKKWSIKMEKRHVPASQLEVLKTERKLNTSHPFIRQLRKMRQNLYVVHETIEASEKVSYEESTKATGKIAAQLYAKFLAKGTSMRKQSITIPKGCILAFRVIQVTIEDAEWGIHYFPENYTSTFVSDGKQHTSVLPVALLFPRLGKVDSLGLVRTPRSSGYCHCCLHRDNCPAQNWALPSKILLETSQRSVWFGQCFWFPGITHGQFGELKEEVEQNCQPFSHLPDDLRNTFLEAIKAALGDKDVFHELAQKMEEVCYETNTCELTTQNPKLKDVLSSLQSLPRSDLQCWAKAISYTLDALSEQTEEQQLVLLESLEKEAVQHQLNLLEQFFKCKTQDTEGRSGGDDIVLPFTADGEDKTTIAMLEMSGVRIEKDGFAICDQEGFLALEALYASLYALDLLSNSE